MSRTTVEFSVVSEGSSEGDGVTEVSVLAEDAETLLVSRVGRVVWWRGDLEEEEMGVVPAGGETDMEVEISIFVAERNADGVTNLGDTPASK